jgi:hypothetical protein
MNKNHRACLSSTARRATCLLLLWLVLTLSLLLLAACSGSLPANLEQPGPVLEESVSPPVEAADPQPAASLAPTTTRAPTTTTTEPPVIEIGWVGDLTPGSKYGLPPEQGRALFTHTRDLLHGPDLMIANLEGTLSEGGPSKCDGRDSTACFAFQAPPEYAAALAWAGIDLVSLANNHAYDYLARGLEQTQDALDEHGIAYTGLVDQITVREVKGIRVATVGFSPYHWNSSLLDIPAAEQLVAEAAAQADVVVVLMHAGAEGADKTRTPEGAEHAYGEYRGHTRDFARAVVDAGADLVLGAGPHVVRGIERYQGKLIAYSLGNFAGWGNFRITGNLGISGLLTVRVDRQGNVLGGRWASLRLEPPGVPRPDPEHTGARLVRDLSLEDFEDTFVLDDEGLIALD